MRAYEIAKGTKGLLLSNANDGKWDTQDFTTTKDLLYTDVVIDPIRVYNGNTGVDPNDTAYKLAERGYMVFCDDSTNNYLLAIPQYAVNVA